MWRLKKGYTPYNLPFESYISQFKPEITEYKDCWYISLDPFSAYVRIDKATLWVDGRVCEGLMINWTKQGYLEWDYSYTYRRAY